MYPKKHPLIFLCVFPMLILANTAENSSYYKM